MTTNTSTPLGLLRLPDKSELLAAFKGKKLSELRTPAAIVDRSVFTANSERVAKETKARGMGFRVHVKTHKTLEGTRIQCEAAGGVSKIICSTLPEVHHVVKGGLVDEGLVDDILYSMPIGEDKIHDLATLQTEIGAKGVIRLMVDNPAQVEALQRYNESSGRGMKWAVFVKVDGGGRRAGVPPTSQQMKDLIQSILASSAVEIFGFYSHFGHSYASDSLDAATEYYKGEIHCANSAAKLARELGATGDWVLSVGATPTTHAATSGHDSFDGLEGTLELHAGCYCMCDLQQYATSLVPQDHLALTVLTSIVSLYPHRNEAMCDTGAISVSKDTGPLPGYGNVLSPAHATGWKLGKVSQEHGVLMHRDGEKVEELSVGDRLRIVPQHACLVCASQPWLYVVEDGGDEVMDVWVPCKGW